MSKVIIETLKGISFVPIETITEKEQQIFHHQLLTVKPFYDADPWWWVQQRILALASVFGSDKDSPYIFQLLNAPKNSNHERRQFLAASALAQTTNLDFRFDEHKKPNNIRAIHKKYQQHLKIK